MHDFQRPSARVSRRVARSQNSNDYGNVADLAKQQSVADLIASHFKVQTQYTQA